MMMSAPRSPERDTDSEALEILRRIEPVLSRLATKDDIAKLDDRLRKVETDMARLDGRVSQMPTTWQLLIGVIGIIGVVFALLRFALP